MKKDKTLKTGSHFGTRQGKLQVPDLVSRTTNSFLFSQVSKYSLLHAASPLSNVKVACLPYCACPLTGLSLQHH